MSHISVMKIAFADREMLITALHDLGYEIIEGEGLAISDGERSVPVDFLVQIPCSAPVGFRKGKNGWHLTADWFRVMERKKDFENKVKQQYACVSVSRALEKQGFSLAQQEKDEEGRIRLVLRRFS